jgi:hypothetical protein
MKWGSSLYKNRLQGTLIESMMIEGIEKGSRDWEAFATYIRSFKLERYGDGVRSMREKNLNKKHCLQRSLDYMTATHEERDADRKQRVMSTNRHGGAGRIHPRL